MQNISPNPHDITDFKFAFNRKPKKSNNLINKIAISFRRILHKLIWSAFTDYIGTFIKILISYLTG
jgi:hypothetical protein